MQTTKPMIWNLGSASYPLRCAINSMTTDARQWMVYSRSSSGHTRPRSITWRARRAGARTPTRRSV